MRSRSASSAWSSSPRRSRAQGVPTAVAAVPASVPDSGSTDPFRGEDVHRRRALGAPAGVPRRDGVEDPLPRVRGPDFAVPQPVRVPAVRACRRRSSPLHPHRPARQLPAAEGDQGTAGQHRRGQRRRSRRGFGHGDAAGDPGSVPRVRGGPPARAELAAQPASTRVLGSLVRARLCRQTRWTASTA